jgi:sarcosine oxidase
MQNTFETIVLGLGAMGSAAVYQLARRGNRVLGLDQFSPPHHYGSSHGETRIIRQALGEGQAYVPLVLRSYELWREIEKETGQELLIITGGLVLESQRSNATMHGRRNFLDQTIRCAQRFDIRHQILEAKEIRRRYPQFAVTDESGYFEYETGYLKPELCIQAQLHLAEGFGARIQINEKVLSVSHGGPGTKITIETDRGLYHTEKFVIAAGAWIHRFLDLPYSGHFKIHRQVMYWFNVRDDSRAAFAVGQFPIFIWIFQRDTDCVFYGFPSLDGKTVKIASEQYARFTTPEKVGRKISEREKKSMFRTYVHGRLPAVVNLCSRAETCLYTTSSDSNFVIDFYTGHNGIVIASPCSGHGFKHSAAIGEVLAELVTDGKSKIDISSFKMERFASSVGSAAL